MLGYAAAASVLATFCMRTMIPLKVLALTSNLLFALYGYFDGLHPVLFLHLILFPINLIRLIQFERLVREVGGADRSELDERAIRGVKSTSEDSRDVKRGRRIACKQSRCVGDIELRTFEGPHVSCMGLIQQKRPTRRIPRPVRKSWRSAFHLLTTSTKPCLRNSSFPVVSPAAITVSPGSYVETGSIARLF